MRKRYDFSKGRRGPVLPLEVETVEDAIAKLRRELAERRRP